MRREDFHGVKHTKITHFLLSFSVAGVCIYVCVCVCLRGGGGLFVGMGVGLGVGMVPFKGLECVLCLYVCASKCIQTYRQ